jgi:pyruvate,water dikinase
VVADIASPDTWVVDASSRAVLSEKISVKQHKVVLNPAAARQNRVGHVGGEDKQAGTSVTVPVPAADQARACLSAEQVQALVALGTKVQRHYRAPQDVEWGLKNGQLFLLQARWVPWPLGFF